MSQPATEAPARPAPARPVKKENVFTRKIGALPTWGWILIAAGLIGIYYLWNRNRQAQQAATGASQVPQFVNQTYVSGVPPVVAGPKPPPPIKCPKGMAWDPDERKCVPERGRKGRGDGDNDHHKRRHRRGHRGREAPGATSADAEEAAGTVAPGSIVPATGLPVGYFGFNPGATTAPGLSAGPPLHVPPTGQ